MLGSATCRWCMHEGNNAFTIRPLHPHRGLTSFEGGSESVPGVSQPYLYHQTASSHMSSSSILSSASDEGDASVSGPGEQTQKPVTLHWTSASCPQSSVAHTYRGGPRGKTDNELSHSDG
jgi:hypothetical protein